MNSNSSASDNFQGIEANIPISGSCNQAQLLPKLRSNLQRFLGALEGSAGAALGDLMRNYSLKDLETIATDPNTSKKKLEWLSKHPNPDVRASVAENKNVPSECIWSLASDHDPNVRLQLAEIYQLPMDVLSALTRDENPYVSARANRTVENLQRLSCCQSFAPVPRTAMVLTVHQKGRQLNVQIPEGAIIELGRAGVDTGNRDIVRIDLEGSSISAVHARINRDQSLFAIVDVGTDGNGSSNGTFLNGARIAPNRRHHFGINDVIQLSRSAYDSAIIRLIERKPTRSATALLEA